jgi:hypothetical protein
MKLSRSGLLTVAVLAGVFSPAMDLSAVTGYQQVPVAIQISSNISDGDLALEEIVRIARNNGFRAVIVTDRDSLQWEYGLFPLRELIKTKKTMSSIATYGASRYLKDIADLQQHYSDIIIIPGVEAAPFYYWKGNPAGDDFKLYDWHKHMLVIGMDKAEDYDYLPSVANIKSLRQPFVKEDLILLWPLLMLVLGVISARKRKYNYSDDQGRPLGPYSSFWHMLGLTLIFFSLLGLVNNYPYRRLAYDQYHGEQGIKPYQYLINYADQKGAMTFWAHPEAINISKRGNITIETDYYGPDLLMAQKYTGFSILYDGFKKVGIPGGIWDKVLNDYCRGQRSAPVWAIATVEYDQGGSLDSRLQGIETAALVKEVNQTEILHALKSGHLYVIGGDRNLRLQEFSVTDIKTTVKGEAGEEVKVQEFPMLNIRGGGRSGDSGPVKIDIIRNGEIIKTFEEKDPFMIKYIDRIHETGKKIYYRLQIQNQKTVLLTNPIFVNFKE